MTMQRKTPFRHMTMQRKTPFRHMTMQRKTLTAPQHHVLDRHNLGHNRLGHYAGIIGA